MITFEQFKQLEIRTAKVLSVENHPNADKLYVMKIDLGVEQRQIVAGIRPCYPDANALVGKTIVVLTNMEAAVIRGVESNGMLLAASKPDRSDVVVLVPDRELPPGCAIS
jgi:methionyl-tRNA synthetase